MDRTPDEWIGEYGIRRPLYVEYVRRVETLLKDLLKAGGIDVIQVESRAKTVESFADKIQRKDRSDRNPFESVTDLAGVRIITYYTDDVKRVGKLIGNEFEIDVENSVSKSEELAKDQFGYRSDHYVAKLSATRSKLIEWQAYTGIPIEFQVRTALQHAWAAVDHKIKYKSANEAPTTLQRRLFQLSALFELADEQFAVLRDQWAATFTAYSADVTSGQLHHVPIDTSSLAAYWNLSRTAAKVRTELAAENLTDDSEVIEEARLARDRRDSVRALREVGITTLAQLDEYLQSERFGLCKAALVKYFEQPDAPLEIGEESLSPNSSLDDYLTMILTIDHPETVGDIEPRIYIDQDFIDGLKAAGANLR
ncbi:GTP pyrophosphokinase [Mycobacterium paraterrae]|uniref:RelA/SpoT domain-containing protein n=1 Tax=Mycobacterium paraterrae TaxID=577492 RepID=A0ABY3VJS6_9MYCO|nr:hypothetical protein [Mycobacterium paraterrae]UMB67687.1 hypothetical protein MKK62_14345 [Mycobacterium paraterrae]